MTNPFDKEVTGAMTIMINRTDSNPDGNFDKWLEDEGLTEKKSKIIELLRWNFTKNVKKLIEK